MIIDKDIDNKTVVDVHTDNNPQFKIDTHSESDMMQSDDIHSRNETDINMTESELQTGNESASNMFSYTSIDARKFDFAK